MLTGYLLTAAAASWHAPHALLRSHTRPAAVRMNETPIGEFLTDASTRIACSSVASAATWTLVTDYNIGSVAASSLIGLIAGVTLPTPLATAAFCGTFAGMSSQVVAPGVGHAAALGAAAAALLATLDATSTRVLKGYGGRLGAVAALSAVASIAVTPSLVESGLLFQPSLAAAAAMPKALGASIAVTVAGSAAMRLWARRVVLLLLVGGSASPLLSTPSKRAALSRRLSNPVASASVVGLAASIVLGPSRTALAASAFAGTFVSMSAPDKLRSTRGLLGAAAFAGLAQAGLSAVGVGAGGKLGAAAAIGVLVMRSFRAASAVMLVWRARSGPYEYTPAKQLF